MSHAHRSKERGQKSHESRAKAANVKRRAWTIQDEKAFREREAKYIEEAKRKGIQNIPASPLPEIQQLQNASRGTLAGRTRSPTCERIRKAAHEPEANFSSNQWMLTSLVLALLNIGSQTHPDP
jgi:molecular chaperone GrpE (heat shock protein)